MQAQWAQGAVRLGGEEQARWGEMLLAFVEAREARRQHGRTNASCWVQQWELEGCMAAAAHRPTSVASVYD